MKLIIFAGGHGTRLWPLSRKNSPKQFDQFFEGKSTLQLAIDRLKPAFDIKDIYISTNKKFKKQIQKQIPNLPEENFFLEPARRDLAPAVGLSFAKLQEQGHKGAVAILFADHLMDHPDQFRNALKAGEELIEKNPERIIYMGEKPRFANHNLGWVTVGEEIEKVNSIDVLEYKSWVYRPPLDLCKTIYESGKSFWNPGYFVTSVDFLTSLYEKFMPEMHKGFQEILRNQEAIEEIYPTLESISFDDAILVKTKPDQAVVLKVDLGWSDPGTLYALKEALAKKQEDNITRGETVDINSSDCLLINNEDKKVLATADLKGMIVVNTQDALLVVPKESVPRVKELVKKLEEIGLENYI